MRKIAVIAAHPDDEVIGLGGQMPGMPQLTIVHVTDGAPRDMRDALSAGFTTRASYARARREELAEALELAGIRPEQTRQIGAVDQEASLDLAGLTRQLVAQLKDIRPDVVLTHPYEGGHPDHDATAFAVHTACRLLDRERIARPKLVEFTSYHARNGNFIACEFLPFQGVTVTTIVLTEPQRDRKRRMMESFSTQRAILSGFPLELERFRPAPRYDFSRPPHEGLLFYEHLGWGMTGERWRSLAISAQSELCG